MVGAVRGPGIAEGIEIQEVLDLICHSVLLRRVNSDSSDDAAMPDEPERLVSNIDLR